ncbi:hypothetical protein V8B97DRAFT_724746 [Scleroderma yunnanense]
MVVAIAPWSIALQPGEKEAFVPHGDIQIKNAALSDVLADENGRTTIKFTYPSLAVDTDEDEDDEDDDKSYADTVTTVLCSLTPGKIEQASCEIIIEQDVEYVFELVGKNPVYLYGNYIDQEPLDQPPMGSDMDSDDDSEDEDAYNLAEVSSDVEIEVDADEADLEDAGRFEELEDEEMHEAESAETNEKKSLKRPRESDTAETEETKLSKSQRKKLAKKLKAESGNAAPPPTEEKPAGDAKKEEKKPKKDKKETNEKEGETKAKDSDNKQSRVIEGGVKVRDVKIGTGKMAKKGDKVSVRYIGKLTNGTVFDKNTKGTPFTFTLGAGDVIKGWDIGIAGMQINGEREVTVPPSMGYGKRKMQDIPANSTLVFEVKLLSLK